MGDELAVVKLGPYTCHWHGRPTDAEQDSCVIRVVSLNLLAEGLAKGSGPTHGAEAPTPASAGPDSKVKRHFLCPQADLRWADRWEMHKENLVALDPDLIGFQEVDLRGASHELDIRGDMEALGYKGAFLKKNGTERVLPGGGSPDQEQSCGGAPCDGVALFWRTRPSERRGAPCPTFEPVSKELDWPLGNSPFVALAQALRVRQAEQDRGTIHAVVTHLKAGMQEEVEEARLKQAKALLDNLHEVAGNDEKVLLMADLNSQWRPWDREDGRPRGDGGVEPQVYPFLESRKLVSVYKEVLKKELEYTCWGGWHGEEAKGAFDYIFWRGDNLRPVRVLGMPAEEDIMPPHRLPNKAYPSDHFPVAADVVLVKDLLWQLLADSNLDGARPTAATSAADRSGSGEAGGGGSAAAVPQPAPPPLDAPRPRPKTELCRHYMQGFCKMGDSCKFAHGADKLEGAPQCREHGGNLYPHTIGDEGGWCCGPCGRKLPKLTKVRICPRRWCPYTLCGQCVDESLRQNRDPVPDRVLRTRLCRYLGTPDACSEGSNCTFAHSEEEIPGFRSRLCKEFTKAGRCRNWRQCSFAHCEEELRGKAVRRLASPPLPSASSASTTAPGRSASAGGRRSSRSTSGGSRSRSQGPEGRQATPRGGSVGGAQEEVPPAPYKVALCWHFHTRRQCPFGERCSFAHGEGDPKPDKPVSKQKQGFCKDLPPRGSGCWRGSGCAFAHDESEIAGYKTKLCRSHTDKSRSSCVHGEWCSFAHGEAELRRQVSYPATTPRSAAEGEAFYGDGGGGLNELVRYRTPTPDEDPMPMQEHCYGGSQNYWDGHCQPMYQACVTGGMVPSENPAGAPTGDKTYVFFPLAHPAALNYGGAYEAYGGEAWAQPYGTPSFYPENNMADWGTYQVVDGQCWSGEMLPQQAMQWTDEPQFGALPTPLQ